MTQGLELVGALQWVYATLVADVTITDIIGVTGVYAEYVPQGADLPAIVMINLSPGDDFGILGATTARLMTQPLYLVKGIVEGASFGGDLATLANRIDVLLDKQSGVAADGTVIACTRQRPHLQSETGPGGEQYRHLGGVYRILVQ